MANSENTLEFMAETAGDDSAVRAGLMERLGGVVILFAYVEQWLNEFLAHLLEGNSALMHAVTANVSSATVTNWCRTLLPRAPPSRRAARRYHGSTRHYRRTARRAERARSWPVEIRRTGHTGYSHGADNQARPLASHQSAGCDAGGSPRAYARDRRGEQRTWGARQASWFSAYVCVRDGITGRRAETLSARRAPRTILGLWRRPRSS